MKKALTLLLTLCLLLTCSSALAAGKLEVTQETYVPFESNGSFYGYIFAEVQNTGDKNIEYGSGVLELLSEEGDSADSADVYTMYPVVLAPGETGYIYYMDVADVSALSAISDHTFSAIGKSTKEEPIARLEGKATYDASFASHGGIAHPAVSALLTNTTEQTVYDLQAVVALYDAEGKLLFVGTDINYNIGLPAGQTLELIFDVDNAFVEKWAADGVKVANAVAFAYPEN